MRVCKKEYELFGSGSEIWSVFILTLQQSLSGTRMMLTEDHRGHSGIESCFITAIEDILT